jgi:cytochrome b
VKVWDRAVRSLHWGLAVAVVAAWLTGGLAGLQHEVHELAGYVAGAVVLARLAWGGVWGRAGSRFARFSQFVRGPAVTWAYLKEVAKGSATRHLGHNPLGGWMVVLLLSCVAALSITGILYTTDWLWGYEWLYRLHAVLGWLILALVALHLLGVLFTSGQHGENLVRAMITGDKPEPKDRDIA